MPCVIVANQSIPFATRTRKPILIRRILKQGAIPVADSPEEFAAYIKDEIAKWGAVVKSANIKPD
jgi:tripartite-type tricarboxylate transporter receptor subunit TctC